jgi:hypothetical protein
MTSRPVGPVTIIVDGRRARSSTSAATLGSPYVVALQTSITESWLPVEVRSVYVGARDSTTHVTHLTQMRGQDPEIETLVVDSGVMPVPYARPRLLLDHLQRLHDLLVGLGHDAAIAHGDDAALAVAS